MTRSGTIRELRAERESLKRRLDLTKPRSGQRLIIEAKLARVTKELLDCENVRVRIPAVTERRVQ